MNIMMNIMELRYIIICAYTKPMIELHNFTKTIDEIDYVHDED
jgi:hypothetical protein